MLPHQKLIELLKAKPEETPVPAPEVPSAAWLASVPFPQLKGYPYAQMVKDPMLKPGVPIPTLKTTVPVKPPQKLYLDGPGATFDPDAVSQLSGDLYMLVKNLPSDITYPPEMSNLFLLIGVAVGYLSTYKKLLTDGTLTIIDADPDQGSLSVKAQNALEVHQHATQKATKLGFGTVLAALSHLETIMEVPAKTMKDPSQSTAAKWYFQLREQAKDLGFETITSALFELQHLQSSGDKAHATDADPETEAAQYKAALSTANELGYDYVADALHAIPVLRAKIKELAALVTSKAHVPTDQNQNVVSLATKLYSLNAIAQDLGFDDISDMALVLENAMEEFVEKHGKNDIDIQDLLSITEGSFAKDKRAEALGFTSVTDMLTVIEKHTASLKIDFPLASFSAYSAFGWAKDWLTQHKRAKNMGFVSISQAISTLEQIAKKGSKNL